LSKAIYLFGIHSVDHLLQSRPELIIRLYIDQSRDDQRIQSVLANAQALGIAMSRESRQRLDEMTGHQQHQGCVAECHIIKPGNERDLEQRLDQVCEDVDKRPPLLLLLDQVQDPHNLGACLRSADAAGVHAVIAPKDNSAPLTATVVKSSAGAAMRVPYFQVTNLARSQQAIKQRGIWLVGTSAEAQKTVFETDLRVPLGLVLGSEGKGMRRLVEQNCDFLAALPMLGQVSSLNVSVSAGICLYETLRQRQYGG